MHGHTKSARLQHDTIVAAHGLITDPQRPAVNPGTVLLQADPACELPAQPSYQSHELGDDAAAAGLATSCVARLGSLGCPFEQPLQCGQAAAHAIIDHAGAAALSCLAAVTAIEFRRQSTA